jgi:carbonic anhydrase
MEIRRDLPPLAVLSGLLVPVGIHLLAIVGFALDVDTMDHAAFESLHSWRLNHEKTGGKVRIEEVQAEWYKPAAEGRPRCGREA